MLGNKQDRAIYSYDDEYMYFSFGGEHSSKYHLFIQNSKELTIENSINPSSEYTNAMMQEGTYYLGTSRKQKTFKRKCAAKLSGIEEYRRMMKWLTVGTTGELIFDSDIYWGWSVVLDTVGDSTFAKRGDFLFVEFEITFKTIGTYLAHSVYPATWIQPQPVYDESGEVVSSAVNKDQAYIDVISTNSYGIPTVMGHQAIDAKQICTTMSILDICNTKQDFVFSLNPDTNQNIKDCEIKIEYDNKEYLYAKFEGANTSFSQLEYDSSRSTFCVNEEIAEENIFCKLTRQLNGLLSLGSNEPCELHIVSKLTETGRYIFKLDEESYSKLVSEDFDYICFTNYGNISTIYNEDPYGTHAYTSNVSSYVGIKNHYAESKYIGYYIVGDSPFIYLYVDNEGDPISNLNEYKLYAGNLKKVTATLTTTETPEYIPYTIKVTSYNNL